MKYYKTFSELDGVREHDDCSVIGSEFINFFSSLLAIRLENYIRDCGISGKSGKDVLRILQRGKKIFDGKQWVLAPRSKNEVELLQKLALLPKPEPKKRGRKPKPKPDSTQPKRGPGRPKKEVSSEDADKPKKKRGRPRKEVSSEEENKPKRGPDRPKKEVDPNETEKPKRKVGRPKKKKKAGRRTTKAKEKARPSQKRASGTRAIIDEQCY